jgi:hypothetical protein
VLEISVTDLILDIHLAQDSIEDVSFGMSESAGVDLVKAADGEKRTRPGNLFPKLGERRWGRLSHGAADHDD